ncbi:MAG: sugar ABC transporter ATP-binding protein [Synergistaceae bacterium]|jgi:ribose transport system ATP-binding protein|nr:sugar ABC transporter ATP-binding protein [Synergistaceae bacterium]
MDKIASPRLLQIDNVTKTFPGVKALLSVNLEVRRGSVHALLGENGAGKSTLVKIVGGGYLPDPGGSMTFDGAPYAPSSPYDAIIAGVRVVHQELNLLPYLSVAENIFLDSLPRRGPFVDYRKLYSETGLLLSRVGLDLNPASPVELLSVAQMQLVEIAKAISTSCKLLILDEPTASLSSRDAERLFGIVRALRDQGLTTIYISHHLKEIYEIADCLSILRNGEMVTTRPVSGTSIPQIVSAMVGRQLDSEYPVGKTPASRETIMEVRNLRFDGNKYPVSFSLKKGEILGIAGLIGSKRTETVRAIFGADRKKSGEVFIGGKKVDIRSPADAVEAGLSLLTEDRKGQGLVLDMTLANNVTLAAPDKVSRAGVIDMKAERLSARRLSAELDIKTPSVDQLVRNLSGGNQQKVVLAKWLFKDANILIFDEPTRGIDVGAKYEIYLLLWTLLEKGKGILIVSSDLNELMGICHRILVFSDGKITADLERGDFDQERILSYAYQNYID